MGEWRPPLWTRAELQVLHPLWIPKYSNFKRPFGPADLMMHQDFPQSPEQIAQFVSILLYEFERAQEWDGRFRNIPVCQSIVDVYIPVPLECDMQPIAIVR